MPKRKQHEQKANPRRSGGADKPCDSLADGTEEFDAHEFKKILRSILGDDGTIGVEQGDSIIWRPIGPDKIFLIYAIEAFARNEINNREIKQKLLPWCTDDEYAYLDNLYPDEKEEKNEKDEKSFTDDLEEEIDPEEFFLGRTSNR